MTRLAEELAEAGHSVTLLSAGDPAIPRLESTGRLSIRRLSMTRLMFPLVWTLELSSLHRRFDVVIEEAMGGEHAPFLGRFLSGSPTVGFWYQDNRPLVAAMYGRPASVLGGVVQACLLRSGRGGFAIANSHATEEWLVTKGFQRSRVAVSFPFVAAPSNTAPPAPFAARKSRIVTIGNLRPSKRFEEAMSVLREVRATVPDAELVILGRAQDDGYLSALRAKAESAGLAGAVHFLVSATDVEKFALLATAKVLTVHSPIEGFGWTIIEAGLSGVPCVGNEGVSHDSLRDGFNGVRVPFSDVSAYRRAIVRLLTDPDEWTRLSEGAVRVAHEFTEGSSNARVEQVLRAATEPVSISSDGS